jgi:predicted signal transduction protein with EAL and GGDEF domain
VLLEDLEDAGDAARVAERIEEAFSVPLVVEGRTLRVSASLGIAHGTESDELLRRADVAMYRAKSSGKARFAFFDPALDKVALNRLELTAELQRATARNEFVLHYQPTLSLLDGRVTGVEALIRWNHPERGLVPPLQFVPLAEETGLIVPIGRWVLTTACRQAARWQERFPVEPPLRVSVNLSARQLQDPGLIADVAEAVAQAGLDPAALVLELTESAIVEGGEEGGDVLRALHRLGVAIALDDFGTGYSSLRHLQELPVQMLKIDRSFVSSLDPGSREEALVRGVCELGKSLGIELVGEGIEGPAQAEALERLGCPIGQGFHLAVPVDADGLENQLRRL